MIWGKSDTIFLSFSEVHLMKVAYVRVSTEEQNEARQIEALKKHSIEKWFTEKISGKSMDRCKPSSSLDEDRLRRK